MDLHRTFPAAELVRFSDCGPGLEEGREMSEPTPESTITDEDVAKPQSTITDEDVAKPQSTITDEDVAKPQSTITDEVEGNGAAGAE
jgi:hypothetical protein